MPNLRKVSALTALADMGTLWYNYHLPGTAGAAAEAWSVAPLTSAVRELDMHALGSESFQPATIQQVQWLTGLTRPVSRVMRMRLRSRCQ